MGSLREFKMFDPEHVSSLEMSNMCNGNLRHGLGCAFNFQFSDYLFELSTSLCSWAFPAELNWDHNINFFRWINPQKINMQGNGAVCIPLEFTNESR